VKLSVVIPARDEAESVGLTVEAVVAILAANGVDYEIVVVDDASTDGTAAAVTHISEGNQRVVYVRSPHSPGFGNAVRAGLDVYTGDAVAIMMADMSDSADDLVRYYHKLEEGYDCVFGTRFGLGGHAHDYPRVKLAINRLANAVIRALFRLGYNDTTNAFKAYRREVIDQVQPLLSHHFNLTVELPLKAIVRGYSYAVVPLTWTNRRYGVSKLKLQEMGSRYMFIVLYVWLEHHLSRGDYRRTDLSTPAADTPAVRDHASAA
jgi:dolichol-phosphate mannosyltransferase